jgi:23S rRNA pseudouridine1911/1915/1917 synthase
MPRQALHSHRLEFTHPITGEHMAFTSKLPEDMQRILSFN